MPPKQFHHLTPAERWVIVRMVRDQHQTHAAAAVAVNCTVRTVTRVLSQFRDTGDVITHHGGGREHAYTLHQMR